MSGDNGGTRMPGLESGAEEGGEVGLADWPRRVIPSNLGSGPASESQCVAHKPLSMHSRCLAMSVLGLRPAWQ